MIVKVPFNPSHSVILRYTHTCHMDPNRSWAQTLSLPDSYPWIPVFTVSGTWTNETPSCSPTAVAGMAHLTCTKANKHRADCDSHYAQQPNPLVLLLETWYDPPRDGQDSPGPLWSSLFCSHP